MQVQIEEDHAALAETAVRGGGGEGAFQGCPGVRRCANSLAVATVLAIRRGALAFLKQSAYDGEAILVLVAVGGAGLGCLAWSSPMAAATQVLINSTGMAWVLGRTAWQIYGPLRTEFGDGTAYMLVATFVAGVALFAARAVAGLVPGAPPLTPFPTDSPANIAAAVLMLLLTLSLHGSLVLMVMNRLVRRLRHLSQRDPLTGLFNRAEWTRQLEAHHRWLGRYASRQVIAVSGVHAPISSGARCRR